MIDTHTHINGSEYIENIDIVISEAIKNGVNKMIIPGVTPAEFPSIIDLIEKYDCLYGAIGVHPSDYEKYNNVVETDIKHLLKHPKIVAIGEIGLDYFYGKDTKDEQIRLFESQLEIAKEFNMPVLIHDRDAHEDCFKLLHKYAIKDVVMHCFSGSPEFARQCLDAGYYIAIGGVVTFKNAKKIKEVVQMVPLERLLLETDAPYLTPVPHRGELNYPKYVKYVAQEISKIKNISFDEIDKCTTLNAEKIFKIAG